MEHPILANSTPDDPIIVLSQEARPRTKQARRRQDAEQRARGQVAPVIPLHQSYWQVSITVCWPLLAAATALATV